MRVLHRASPWGLRYQVVRWFYNGPLTVRCSHRTLRGALLCRAVRTRFDRRAGVDLTYEVRLTPGL